MHRNISSLLTVLKIDLSYLEHFHKKKIITAIQNIRFETCKIFYFSWRLFAKHHTLVPGVRFSVAGLDRAKFGKSIWKFFFIVVIVISILLKPAFWQTLIHRQSLVKIFWLSDKDKITFKAAKKHRCGLRETVKYRNTLKETIRTQFISLIQHFIIFLCDSLKIFCPFNLLYLFTGMRKFN